MNKPLEKKSYEFKTTSDVILNGDIGKYDVIELNGKIAIEFNISGHKFHGYFKKISDTEIELKLPVDNEMGNIESLTVPSPS